MKIASIATTIAVLAIGASAQAVTLANWTFETTVPTTAGPHVAEAGLQSGVAEASGFHVSTATVYSNPVGNGSAESFSSNNWAVDDYYQFKFSTAGYQSVTFGWDQSRSSTGPADFKVSVSTDGVSFSDVTTYVVSATSFSGTTYNPLLTFTPVSLSTASNSANVWVRLIATSAPTSTGGTNRVDNIIVDGEAVPEPATMMVLGLGLAAAAARRKRK